MKELLAGFLAVVFGFVIGRVAFADEVTFTCEVDNRTEAVRIEWTDQIPPQFAEVQTAPGCADITHTPPSDPTCYRAIAIAGVSESEPSSTVCYNARCHP